MHLNDVERQLRQAIADAAIKSSKAADPMQASEHARAAEHLAQALATVEPLPR